MAEFAEVMRQAERMCKAHERCETCPLYDYCDQFNDTRGGQWHVDAVAMEQAVMDWVEKNPEPKYPTWGEYIRTYIDKPYITDDDALNFLNSSPIPADIAEKLGVKAK